MQCFDTTRRAAESQSSGGIAVLLVVARRQAEGCKIVSLRLAHLLLARRLQVVVPHQMQRTVDDVEENFVFRLPLVNLGLSGGVVAAGDDFAIYAAVFFL